MRKQITGFIASRWRDSLIIFILFSYVLSMLLVNLRRLVPQLNSESPTELMVASGQGLANDVLFLPIRLIQYLMLKLGLSDLDLRFASVLFAALACISIYLLLHKWHTKRVSFAITVLFASSSIFLSISRLATPEVLYFLALPILLICGSWLRRKSDVTKLPIATLAVGLLLYLPGMWLFISVGAIALRRRLRAAWRLNTTRLRAAAAGVFALSIAPLIYGFWQNTGQMVSWLGLPQLSELSLPQVGSNFIGIFDALFWFGPDDRTIWLVGTPILDVFSMVALVLGLYYYQFGYHPVRRRVLFGFALMCVFLLSLGGPVSIALLIPVLYIFMAGGVALLLQQWFTVFPKNPLARTIGLLLISVAVAVSCYYQTQRYFVAWPSTPETIQSLDKKKI
jgi:hypothetical protein